MKIQEFSIYFKKVKSTIYIFFISFIKKILNLKSTNRRLILVFIDSLGIYLISTFYFRKIIHEFENTYRLQVLMTVLLSITLYLFSGQYKALTRYFNSKIFYQIIIRNLSIFFILYLINCLFYMRIFEIFPWVNLFLILTIFNIMIRLIMRDFIFYFQKNVDKPKVANVAIYGAGSAGAQLAASINLKSSHNIITFLDDDPNLWNRSINGIKIQSPKNLKNISKNLDQIFMAIPTAGRLRLKEVCQSISADFNIPIFQIPTIDELISGKSEINQLSPIAIEDLLGRNVVKTNDSLLASGIEGIEILVTGAGGSIGSEICRKIIKLKPKKLILFDISEPALYKIHQQLSNLKESKGIIVPILGNTQDFNLVSKILKKYQVKVIFHSAAYKHVPLSESNPLEVIKNNVFSTLNIARAALKANLDKAVLISSDKAVRPTNVMGATKRVSEIIFQAFAEEVSKEKDYKTLFSMVRFGNVIGSSGSVVPLFKEQIKNGGPITLTHPEIIRYFMSIEEAAILVIQASVLSEGGEVFLLDMGNPVNIKSLAERMIHLSGLKLKDNSNPDGNISIKITGLRPGEKLFEELLIGDNALPTSHKLIFKAKENFLHKNLLISYLDKLYNYVDKGEKESALHLLSEIVPEWKRP